MDKTNTSSASMRGFIVKRFLVITIIVVVAVVALVALEDFALSGLIARMTASSFDGSFGQVLRLAVLLVSIPFGGGAGLGLAGADIVKLIALLILMVALLIVPIALGAFAFARSAEKRIVAEQKSRDAERAAFYAKRNLMISDMAHDLRTPVMSISGLSQALADGIVEDDETRQRYLHSITAKSEKMGDLVSMLFDFVQLESEGYALDRKPLDLPQLMLREAASAYTDVEDAGMQLRIEVPEAPLTVLADDKQLSRVVANLIANAVRHNAPGTTIVLGLNRRAGVADIIVADDGKVIESSVEKLFEPFTREDAARSGGGSGLGLSIVKTIVDMHGYSISLLQPYGIFTKAFIVTCAVEG